MAGTDQVATTSERASVPPDSTESDDRPELTQDEFDPVGTLTLIFIYFSILAVMWIVMYFVEFADGPTVIG